MEVTISARVLRTQGRFEGCGLDVLRADVFPAKFRSALRIDRMAGALAVRTDPSFRTFNFWRGPPSHSVPPGGLSCDPEHQVLLFREFVG